MFKYVYDYWPQCNCLNKHFFQPRQEALDVIYRIILYVYIQCAMTMNSNFSSISVKPFYSCSLAECRKLQERLTFRNPPLDNLFRKKKPQYP